MLIQTISEGGQVSVTLADSGTLFGSLFTKSLPSFLWKFTADCEVLRAQQLLVKLKRVLLVHSEDGLQLELKHDND